jgi:hypothetical protein
MKNKSLSPTRKIFGKPAFNNLVSAFNPIHKQFGLSSISYAQLIQNLET